MPSIFWSKENFIFLRQKKPAVRNTVVHAAALEAQEASSEKALITLSAKHIFLEDNLPLETFLLVKIGHMLWRMLTLLTFCFCHH